MKTKLVQNVNRMPERQNNMPKDRLTDRKTDRRQNDFSAQLSKQNLFRMLTGCQKDRTTWQKTDGQTDRKTDRRQNNFSAQLSKQKFFRMSTGCQKDSRKTEIQTDRQTD